MTTRNWLAWLGTFDDEFAFDDPAAHAVAGWVHADRMKAWTIPAARPMCRRANRLLEQLRLACAAPRPSGARIERLSRRTREAFQRACAIAHRERTQREWDHCAASIRAADGELRVVRERGAVVLEVMDDRRGVSARLAFPLEAAREVGRRVLRATEWRLRGRRRQPIGPDVFTAPGRESGAS